MYGLLCPQRTLASPPPFFEILQSCPPRPLAKVDGPPGKAPWRSRTLRTGLSRQVGEPGRARWTPSAHRARQPAGVSVAPSQTQSNQFGRALLRRRPNLQPLAATCSYLQRLAATCSGLQQIAVGLDPAKWAAGVFLFNPGAEGVFRK